MKITAINDVNERDFAPNTAAPNKSFIPAGSDFELEEFTCGEMLESNNIWYIKDGFKYYWSGGFNFKFPLESMVANGRKDFESLITKTWATSKGANVNVALIDSGIDVSNTEMMNAVVVAKSKNFVDNSTNLDDKIGHGTKMAGIITGKKNGVDFGMAPQCKLIIYKLFDFDGEPLMPRLLAALQSAAADNDIHVINMSIQIEESIARLNMPVYNSIIAEVDNCINRGKIVLAASGNDGALAFPGSLRNVITVGSRNKGFDLLSFAFGIKDAPLKPIDVFLDCYTVKKLMLNSTLIDFDTNFSSDATALLSALVALKKSRTPAYNHRSLLDDIRKFTLKKAMLKNLDINTLTIQSFL